MQFDSPWTWLGIGAVTWVFLGLIAGRFNAARRGLHKPAPKPTRVRSAQRRSAEAS